MCLAQTTDGFLWLGGPNGLFRFDGTRFEPFGSPFGDRLLSTDRFHDGTADRQPHALERNSAAGTSGEHVPRHNELQATRIASGLQLSKIEGLECREYSLSSDWRTGRLWVAGRIPSESCDLRDAAEFVEKCVPWFQPIVDLRTGLLSRFEVLARWEHPERAARRGRTS
jgi:hypothetical protein